MNRTKHLPGYLAVILYALGAATLATVLIRTARSDGFSTTTGSLKKIIIPSPVNRSSVPSCSTISVPMAAAEDGLFPARFARVHGERKTPVFGLVVSSVLVSALIKPSGIPAQFLTHTTPFTLITSQEILAELDRVLHYPRIRHR